MIRLYLKNIELFKGQSLEILSQQHHNYLINVLRASVGYKLKIFNELCGEFLAEIVSITKKTCVVDIIDLVRPVDKSDKRAQLCLAFAIIKPKRLEMLIDMSTQLGVNVFQPIISQNVTMHKLNQEKIESWIIESTEQSNRIEPPSIMPIMNLEDFISKNRNNFIYANEQEENSKFSLISEQGGAFVNLLVGPEGGWSNKELGVMREMGGASITLGPNILRSETAAATIIAQYCLLKSLKI